MFRHPCLFYPSWAVDLARRGLLAARSSYSILLYTSAMRKILLLLNLSLFLFACETEKNDPAPPLTERITLSEPQIQGDSIATLTWSALNNPDFVDYSVWCIEDSTDSQGYYAQTLVNQAQTTTYLQTYLPYTDYLHYQVIGRLSSGREIKSNIVTLHRPSIKTVKAYTFDVLYDSANRNLYFLGRNGTITQYDVATSQVKATVQVGQVIGYSSLGSYQGRQELYVSSTSGVVHIYDAVTLSKLDEFNPQMGELTDVVAANGQLFVAGTFYSAGGPVQCFDRTTKTKLSSSGYWARRNMRLRKVPNTATDILGVSLSVTPVDQEYHQFSPAGQFLSQSEDRYHGDHPLDALLLEFFPDGDRYITGLQGGIYQRDMTHLADLGHTRADFTCFGFDPIAKVIYAGTRRSTMEVYSMNDYTRIRSERTPLYPFKIFREATGSFVRVSTRGPIENYQYNNASLMNKMIVEQFGK